MIVLKKKQHRMNESFLFQNQNLITLAYFRLYKNVLITKKKKESESERNETKRHVKPN